MCLYAKIPESRETETRSTETRFEVALLRSEAKDTPLARPFSRQIGEAGHSHAVGKPTVDRGFDKVGREDGEGECPVHLADRALLALGNAFRARCLISDELSQPATAAGDRINEGRSIL